MNFSARIVYSGKLQPSQVSYTPGSKRCKKKLDAQEKLFMLMTFIGFFRVMQNQHTVVHGTSG